jgi:hypothetical protein
LRKQRCVGKDEYLPAIRKYIFKKIPQEDLAVHIHFPKALGMLFSTGNPG